jgi:hypothetical protein
MLGIIIIVASVSIMAKVAEMEERSSVNWGVITLVLCLVPHFTNNPAITCRILDDELI